MNAQLASLAGDALLLISGPDTLKFLQGQTTCDTRQVSATQAVTGAFCTPQGRMVCDFLLAELGNDAYGLRLRRDLVEAAAASFGKYIVFSRAEINADCEDWQLYGCWGEEAAEALATVLGPLPGAALGVAAGDGFRLLQLDDRGGQFELWLDRRQQASIASRLADMLQTADEQAWRTLQISAGVGRVEAATSGLFLPQDLNYDRIGRINFRKGCYTGQEIIARLHYRGTPKRRSYPARLAGAAPVPGESLFNPGTSQSVGNVVNAASSGEDSLVLACAATGALDKGLRVGSPDGPALQLLELPYSLSDGTH